MITRIGSLRLVQTAVILSTLVVYADLAQANNAAKVASTRAKTNSQRFAADRIDVRHARPNNHHASLLSRAAHGQAISDPPPAPLDGSLIRGTIGQNHVQQVGFMDACDGNCGPVCDCAPGCGMEVIEPGCGCGMVGDCSCGVEYIEPGCGCAVPGDCSCGVEYIEPSCGCGQGGILGSCGCGIEVGCGLESIGPSCGCGMAGGCDCGVEYIEPSCGCPIGDCGCGIETIVAGPSCGLETSCGCDSCSTACNAPCGFGVFLPYLKIDWCRLDLFAGVNAFTGPMNCANTDATNANSRASAGGSFGFYEGFNQGRNLKGILGFDIASQFGIRATQTSLSGSKLTDEQRNQVFLTFGLFRRVDYGLQYGLAIDYLNEDWYYQGDLTQLRGEISWNSNNCHVFGFQFMSGISDETSSSTVLDATGNLLQSTVDFEPVDQYRAFYRRLLACGGDWEAFLGGTDNSDTILGALVNMPLSGQVVMNSGVTYVIPNEDEGSTFDDEAWNLSLGFTYRPGGSAGCGRYCRPMFNVADNGTFIVRRR